MFDLNTFLKKISNIKVSDIHLAQGKAPSLRIFGTIKKVDMPPLNVVDFQEMLKSMIPLHLKNRLEHALDIDFTYEVEGVSRYRVNYCKESGCPKLTMRVVPYIIPNFKELMLPEAIEKLTEYNNGIVFVTGATGSGKSTTIAALLESINKKQAKHIITIEDPIEFVYTDANCLITQRALGVDVEDFPTGIKYALRQDPDIIVIGEIRDRQTIESAIQAAETGHLVLTTLHTNSAVLTINRILGLFEKDEKDFIRKRLSVVLKGTVAQKLIKKKGGGLVPAVEIMTTTPAIADYIAKDQLGEIESLILRSNASSGLCSMNTSIFNLVKNELIEKETALNMSDNPAELNQMLRGVNHSLGEALKNSPLN